MTAIHETFGDQWFTSSTIITRESFNLTSSNLTFEVRASLPTDVGVFGVIVLIPEKNPFENVLESAFVILMNYHRTIQAGYIRPAQVTGAKLEFIATLQEMNEFSKIYTRLEIFNYSTLQTWSFSGKLDSTRKFSYNFNCSDQVCKTLFNQAKFKLAISLVVSARLVGGDVQEVIRKSKTWDCSSMIIDYVKVYELDHSQKVNNMQMNKSYEKRASDICHQVSSDLGRKQKDSEIIISGISWIFICLAIFLVILILIIVIWVIFLRKQKCPTDQAPDEDIYDDNFEKEEVYEEYNYSNQYEAVNYEQVQTVHEYLQMKAV